MAKEVFMPKLSSTMAVGTLLQWFKEEGDPVEVGEPIFEIMTDKINIEVEAYEEGILLKKYFQEDEEIPVNTVIAYIGTEGEEVPAESPGISGEDIESDDSATTNAKHEEVAENTSEITDNSVDNNERVRATPAARRVARENDITLNTITGTGPNGRIHEQDVLQAIQENTVLVTPLAEKIAKENAIDLSMVSGNGVHGKIEKADVLEFISSQELPTNGDAPVERVKLKGLRKAIADKMLESVRSIPHVTLTSDVDMKKVIELRKALLPVIEKQTGYRISYTEIIMKTVAHVLGNHPKVNAALIDNEIVYNQDVNIGLAVAVENGLIVPSVKQANKKGLAELTKVSKELGAKSRENRLTPDEMRGSTFTISNLGMFAIDGFTPIINPPETAILGVGRIVEKPVVVDGQIEVRPIMVLSLSFDHRVIDGAPAAAFLTELKSSLEDPYSLLV
ncbi:dihydrolipoamide acetyltransferase family protein [Ornithinibacillus bavariensis]|uniref:Dihydrolipoamide acetyltransferase component of pyruvate dehydrogenase complex n=1 Tax=Ornithinibacillus bavariensis TaxID=545502 RepID=A0A919X9F2_9BACI|nr:dihydrolipoamide acetyltransferase family protein [Ornithinibacillus bavariensis]GIO26940.1 dihydrolipoamide acetyltransferase component of pyruvate dehydrogenase complex [Ornithinibacillus bavariensis]